MLTVNTPMIRQVTCPDPDRLQKLLDGSLSPADQSELSGHLDTCVNCQHTLEELATGTAPWADRARLLNRPQAPEAALEQAMERLRETSAGSRGNQETDLAFLEPSENREHLGRLGHYDVVELLGRGGMGVVLKAFDPSLHRLVAIKVLAPHLANNALNRKRFEREARAAAAVRHEHVVAVHAVEEANGLPYLVMEYVRGSSLQERLDRGDSLELKEVLRIGMQTAAGLAAAHAQGLIHRDIKPSNILLENGVERVKITDFGLARAVDDASLTQSGVVAGTPAYMAPEQARGETLDHRVDLFSLGSLLYALCTGRAPFQGNMPMAVLYGVCQEEPRPIQEINPEIPDWLVAIIHKLHAKRPADRFQSASDVADLLGQHLAHLQQPAAVPMPAPVAVFRLPAAAPPRGIGRLLDYEYRSQRTIAGWPLIHIALGIDVRTGRRRVAQGIVAIGGIAIGVVAIGQTALGGIAVGINAMGLVAMGLGACGLLLALGVGAIGGIALGVGALGIIARGAGALGYFTSVMLVPGFGLPVDTERRA
jgi:serine/threonine-protein kinase